MNIPSFLDLPLRKAWFAGVLLLAGCLHSQQPVFQADAGLQMYSVRAQLAKDVPGTLAEIHSWGIKYIEGGGTFGRTPEQFKALLAANGLQEVSGQFSYDQWKTDPEGTARRAQEMGWTYAGTSWIPHVNGFDETVCRNAIEVFNRAGEAAAKHNVHFFYHPHGYEFQPYGDGTLFDLLMRETNPQNVSFQMDIFWIVHPGQDPVKLLKKYAGRWKLMHLKDMRKGTPTGLLTGHSDVTNDVAIGTGMINIPAVLRAAREVGVQWYFIEDESPNSEQQIPQSLAYLRKLSQ
jgi:sugar phosphate isomerase/epimerase